MRKGCVDMVTVQHRLSACSHVCICCLSNETLTRGLLPVYTHTGARLFAGVDELRDLLETALREGPGIEPYTPPAYLKPSAR